MQFEKFTKLAEANLLLRGIEPALFNGDLTAGTRWRGRRRRGTAWRRSWQRFCQRWTSFRQETRRHIQQFSANFFILETPNQSNSAIEGGFVQKRRQRSSLLLGDELECRTSHLAARMI